MPSRTFLAPPVLLLIGIALALTVWSVILLGSEGGGGLLSWAVILVSLSFYAFAVPTLITRSRRLRRGLVAAVGPGGATHIDDVERPRRVTRIGWIALVLSVAAPALMFASSWGLDQALETGPDTQFGGYLFPFIVLAWLTDIIAAVAVCTIAGTRGRGNRLVGVVGGLIVASPIALLFWVF